MRALIRRLAVLGFSIVVTRPILFWFVGVKYRRRRLLPDGPCIVVSNHNSHLDAAILLTAFPLSRIHLAHPVAAADYWKGWLRKLFAMGFLNALPIERNPGKGDDALQPLADALREGHSLILFPEGSRGEAGVVGTFRSGVGRLAQRVPGVLVVPVFLSGPERIWPRGEVIPVPLAIDAIIGKPRAYDPESDPREIANDVREAVLALAPPPPPVPTARPSKPIGIALCGIDAGRRRRVQRALIERFGREARSVGIGDELFEADAEGVREIIGPIAFTRGRAWLGLLGRLVPGRRLRRRRFAALVERAQVSEALQHSPTARTLVGDGSSLVDLVAWADVDPEAGALDDTRLGQLLTYLSGERRIPFREWWSNLRRNPEVWLINVLDLAHAPVPDLLVVLEGRPASVMRELRAGGRALRDFENEAFFDELQRSHGRIAEVLSRRRTSTLFFDADAEETAIVEAIAERVAEIAASREPEPTEETR